jgi:DedD protein
MDYTQDTEITLGTAKLLALFFGLVMVCAVFFALGYTLGRKSDMGLVTSAAVPMPTASSSSKPASSASPPAQPMTFYKAVEQKDANVQLTPATDSVAATPAASAQPMASTASPTAGTQPAPAQNANPPDPMAPIPPGGYFVQVAAVSKQEDADSLVDALKQKQYPAFVASGSSADKLLRVQMGPFGDIKEAEAMRTRLINDGYNPILKK